MNRMVEEAEAMAKQTTPDPRVLRRIFDQIPLERPELELRLFPATRGR